MSDTFFTDEDLDIGADDVTPPEADVVPVEAPFEVQQPRESEIFRTDEELDVRPDEVLPPQARPGAFVSRSIANIAGGFAEAGKFLLENVPPTGRSVLRRQPELDVGEPFLGSEQITDLMEDIGLNVPPRGFSGERIEPKGFFEEVESLLGLSAGMLSPLGATARTLARRGTQTLAGQARSAGQETLAGGVAKNILDQTVKHPLRALAAEELSVFGSAAGGYYASEWFPGSETAKIWGQTLGGFFPLPVATLGQVPAIRWVGNVIKKTVVPFTKAGARPRAERRFQSLVPDPEVAAGRLDPEAAAARGEPFIAELSPATRSEEPRLMAIERLILKEDPVLDQAFSEATKEARSVLRTALQDVGGEADIGDMVAHTETLRARFLNALDLAAKIAFEKAEARINALDPAERPSQSARIVSDEVGKVQKAVVAFRKKAWLDVPLDETTETAGGQLLYRAMVGQLDRTEIAQNPDLARLRLGASELKHMPDDARRFLDFESNQFFGDETTIRDYQGLRSDLLETARQARAEGKRKTERLAILLAEEVANDLGIRSQQLGDSDAGELLRRALDASAMEHQYFGEGAAGDLTRLTRGGNLRIDPREALEATVGRGGIKGDVAIENILSVAPQVDPEIQASIRQLFIRKAVDPTTGQVNPTSARRFVDEQEDIMNRYPAIRDAILDAADDQEDAIAALGRAKRARNSLHDQKKSIIGRVLNADVGDEINKVVSAPNPRAAARNLRLTAKKDKTGKAEKGLTAGAIDYLITEAARGGQLDENSIRALSGKKLGEALKKPNVRAVMAEFLTKAQITRLHRIAKELTLIEVREGKLPDVGGVISDVPNRILTFALTLVAARQGARLGAGPGGGASLKMAQEASSNVKRLLGNLTRDRAREMIIQSIEDGGLFESLLIGTSTRQGRIKSNQKLNAWLAGPGKEFIDLLDQKYGAAEQDDTPAIAQDLDAFLDDDISAQEAAQQFGTTEPEGDSEIFDDVPEGPLDIETRAPRPATDEGLAAPFGGAPQVLDADAEEQQASDSGSVSPDLIDRIIQVESGGDPNAVSDDGAVGLMQIMPATARNPGFGVKGIDPETLKDPDVNRAFGTEYFNALLQAFEGDLVTASVAYNWGPRNARRWKSQGSRAANLPDETRDYIERLYGAAQQRAPT